MKKFVIGVIAVLSLAFCGCTVHQQEEVVEEYYSMNDHGVYAYTDPETGVNYLIFTGYNRGGITVRYNSDGTIMVTESVEGED